MKTMQIKKQNKSTSSNDSWQRALTLLVWWQEGCLTHKKTCYCLQHSHTEVFPSDPAPSLTWSNSGKGRRLKKNEIHSTVVNKPNRHSVFLLSHRGNNELQKSGANVIGQCIYGQQHDVNSCSTSRLELYWLKTIQKSLLYYATKYKISGLVQLVYIVHAASIYRN